MIHCIATRRGLGELDEGFTVHLGSSDVSSVENWWGVRVLRVPLHYIGSTVTFKYDPSYTIVTGRGLDLMTAGTPYTVGYRNYTAYAIRGKETGTCIFIKEDGPQSSPVLTGIVLYGDLAEALLVVGS